MRRVAAAGRVPRTRHRRAAPGLGGARAGHPQPARGGAGGLRVDEDAADEVEDAATTRRSAWRWPGGPNVGKSHADQHLAGRGAPGRLRPAGHHARRHPRAVRARRPPLRADRHRRPAPQGQGLRGDREVLGRQDPAGDRRRQCRAAAARRDAGRRATRTRTSPATSSSRAARWCVAINKWDAIDDYQRQMLRAFDRERLAFLKFARCCTSRRSSGRASRAVWKAIGAGPCLGHAQDADAGAHAADRRKPCEHQAPRARRPLPAQAALRPPGRHEPAGDRDPRQLAGARDRQLQTLPGRPRSASTSSWSARRCASRCAPASNPFDAKGS